MKKYDKCKDSGVAWIGEIPEDWTETKGKYCFDITTGRLDANAEEIDGIYPFFTCSNRIKKINTYAFDCEALLIAGNGDVGYTQYYNGKFNAYQRTYVLRNFSMDIYPIYVKYYFLGLFKQSIKTKFVGSVIDFIKVGDLQNFKICFPRLDRQRDIAHFLDNKLEVIDKIIDDKNDLIIKLKEYRQAIINEALTKGLDKNALLKDSGVKWIEEIPEGWNIKRLKYISRAPLMYGANEVASDENAEHPRYIRITDIDETGHLKTNTFKSLLPEIAKTYLLDKNDILFARSGASVGKTYIHESTTNACFAGYLIKFSVNSDIAMAKFIYYNTLTNKYLNWINRNTIQATIQNISAEKYNNYEIILPSLEKQNEIVNYLNCKTNKIGNTIMDIEQQITKLQEYKKSIISEAVTGKIKIEEHISKGVI